MTLLRHAVRVSLFTVVALFGPGAHWAHATGLVVCGCHKVSERQLQPGVVESTYRAVLINFGPSIPGATAEIVAHPRNVAVVDGTLTFGPVSRWRGVWSDDTYTIVRYRPTVFDCLKLEWRVTPTSGNRPPVANAGPDQTVTVGSPVVLDGSGSTDADGDSLTFAWSFESIPAGSQASLTDAASVSPRFDVDVPGTYVARLIVNDGRQDSLPDTVIVSTENSPPVANAGPDQTVLVGSTVTLDGSGSTDVDGDALTYAWSFVSVPDGSTAVLSDAGAVAPTFDVDQPGSYELRLIVHDGFAASSPDTVTITTENSPPVADAGADQTVVAGEIVSLGGAGSSDPDGNPLSFQWSLTTRPAGSNAALVDATTIAPSFTADLPGTYVAQLIVNDGFVDSAPDTATITTTNTAPVADAGPDQRDIATGAAVALDGSGSRDADGHTLTYQWSLLSRPAGSGAALDDPSAIGPTFTVDLPGDYVVQLIVHDGIVASAPDTVLITVTATLVTVAATDDRAAENGPDPGVFTISRTGPTADPLTVAYELTGPAANGVDYTTVATSVTIPAGSSTATVTITPIADPDVEGTESVILALSHGSGYSIGTPALASVTITDSVVVTVTASDPDAAELGPDPGEFTFTRAGGDQTSPLTVLFSRDGSAVSADYADIGLVVTIPANAASATVAITPRPDNALEGPETLVLSITPTLTYTVGSPGTATVTIADDPVVVNVTATDPVASEAGPDVGVFTFTRAGGNPAEPLTVFYSLGGSAANNSDYLFLGSSVVFPAGELAATVTITPRADDDVEGPETVIFTLQPRTTYSIGASSSATVTIADDPTIVTIEATDPDASEAGPDPGLFTLTRSGGNQAAQLVVIVRRGGSATSGSDYVSLGGANFAVTFPANQSTVTVTVTPIPDPTAEGPETVILTINPSPAIVIGTPGSATVTIADGS